MPIRQEDPTDELKNRKREMDTAVSGMDEKELAEREEAAQRYAGEDERHFVDYAQACIDESVKAMKDIRRVQNDCWNVYNENEPTSYRDKEVWQSRTVIPKPHQTVQFGAAAVKKAFQPHYLSVKNPANPTEESFWQKTLEFYLNREHANFLLKFVDATIMALAVGISQEVIPRWVPGKGLEFTLTEPWKIHRDPDSLSREHQSGNYWIHQEWLDWFVLRQGEMSGRYFDIDRVRNMTEGHDDDPFLTKEAIAARKEMIYERTKYRKLYLTSEFWGIVLDKRGEMLLPRAQLTIAGGRVIQYPKSSPYRVMRWPGVAFSPLPNLLRFGGRGLLEGILTIWEAMNKIMCLHEDNLMWVVNPPTEINVEALQDPRDSAMHPGKDFLTRDTISGQQAVRQVQRKSRTNEVLANMQYYDQNFQRGTLVTDAVQGLPGYRKDMTFRESAQNLDQAMGVYGLMGENLEDGASRCLHGAVETIERYIGYSDLMQIFPQEYLEKIGIRPDQEKGVAGIPKFTGQFGISGMQALMKDSETLRSIREIVLPLALQPRFAKYIKPYKTLRAIEDRVNLKDEGIFVSEEEAQIIDLQERLQGIEESEAIQRLQQMQEIMGAVELVERLQGINLNDIHQAAEEIKLLTWETEQITGGESGTGSQNQPSQSAPQTTGR
jgi:hypothetical protein